LDKIHDGENTFKHDLRQCNQQCGAIGTATDSNDHANALESPWWPSGSDFGDEILHWRAFLAI
jgi:hypothetical protein